MNALAPTESKWPLQRRIAVAFIVLSLPGLFVLGLIGWSALVIIHGILFDGQGRLGRLLGSYEAITEGLMFIAFLFTVAPGLFLFIGYGKLSWKGGNPHRWLWPCSLFFNAFWLMTLGILVSIPHRVDPLQLVVLIPLTGTVLSLIPFLPSKDRLS